VAIRKTTPLQRLLELFNLDRLDSDLFVGQPGPGGARLFGGLVAGQAVMAAGLTVGKGDLHSLHGYFLRPGNHEAPIRYVVHRIRDGRSFTSRDIVAYQSGEAIFSISSSFTLPDEGFEHQEPIPQAPEPEEMAEWDPVLGVDPDTAEEWVRRNPIEVRHVYPPKSMYERAQRAGSAPPEETGDLPKKLVWIRPRGEMPDDNLLHTALLVYASDRGLLGTVA